MADSLPTSPTTNRHQLAELVREKARSLGFDLVGIASAKPSNYRDYFREWLDNGKAGTMEYLSDRFEERTDPAKFLAGARSAICVAMNYHAKLESDDVSTSPRGRVARYALGDDYHTLIKPRLYKLADWLRELVPEAKTMCGVDTVPVMEKELASRAGIGWMGKNTCIINENIGSWILLGEVLTTLELPIDDPAIDRCGSCTRCIDACPTKAITSEYQMDATRCISYLTIEHRDAISPELAGLMGDWLYGCDVCQDVCPWNRKAPIGNESALQPRFLSAKIDADEVLCWTASDYAQAMQGSAIKRVKLPILQRNASIVRDHFMKKKAPG